MAPKSLANSRQTDICSGRFLCPRRRERIRLQQSNFSGIIEKKTTLLVVICGQCAIVIGSGGTQGTQGTQGREERCSARRQWCSEVRRLDRAADLRGKDRHLREALAAGAGCSARLARQATDHRVSGGGRCCAGVPRRFPSRLGRGGGGAGSALAGTPEAGFFSRPTCPAGCPTTWTRRRLAPSSIAACRGTHPRPGAALAFAELSGDHGRTLAPGRGTGGDGAGPVAMARHPPPLRPLRRCERSGAGGMAAPLRDLGAGHFPRTDPVVIMLIHPRRQGSGGPLSRLARGGCIPLLAGFVEPARPWRMPCAREVLEEAG